MRTKKYLIKMLLGFIALFTLSAATAQQSVYWFAAPGVTSRNEGDKPIQLKVGGYTEETNVTIEIPANEFFTPISLTVPAFTYETIDLTPYLDWLESVADAVTSSGLKVTVDQPVTIYYEVNSANPALFPLKGEAALGTEFYTPFQTYTYNTRPLYGRARAAFDILATEDGTTVEITPTRELTGGHPAGVPFTVVLNEGEVYSAEAEYHTAEEHPAGSHIVSDKPVAVTVKDDRLSARIEWGVGSDLTGEQIVPISNLGTTYVAKQGFLNGGGTKIFILATEDNTELFINGSATPIATLSAGETYMYDLDEEAALIVTSAPSYVLHLSGMDTGLSEALLVPVEDEFFYTHLLFTTEENFLLHLLVFTEAGNETGFQVNGDASFVDPASFVAVPGTDLVAGNIYLTPDDIAPYQNNLLTNTAPYYTYALYADTTVSVSDIYYGFLNGITLLEDLEVAITVDSEISCEGNEGALTATATGGLEPYSYEWSTGATTASVTGLSEGTYFVTVTDANGSVAVAEESLVGLTPITVSLVSPTLDGGFNTSCNPEGDGSIELTITGDAPYSIAWSTGATDVTEITGLTPGAYSVTVTDANGCSEADDITLTGPENCQVEVAIIINSEIACNGDEGSLSAVATNGTAPYSYAWSNGETTATISGLTEGGYTVTVTDFYGTTASASEYLSGLEPFEISLFSPTVIGDFNTSCSPEGDGSIILTIEGSSTYTIEWSTGATGVTELEGLLAGTYSVVVTDANGCSEEAEITLSAPENCGCVLVPPTPEVTCSDCSVELSAAKSIVYPGETVCLTSAFNGWNINIQGGTVIVCDDVDLTNKNLILERDAHVIILPSASITVNDLNLNANTTTIDNYGTINLRYNFNYAGTVNNYGNIFVQYYTNCNSAGSILVNTGRIETGYLNINNSSYDNKGFTLVRYDSNFNSESVFINDCEFVNGRQLIVDSRINFTNNGIISVGTMFRFNSTATHFGGGSFIQTHDLFSNDTRIFNESTSCALIIVENSSKFNQGFISGPIFFCDLDGTIEQPGNLVLQGGAAFSCDDCLYDDGILKSSLIANKYVAPETSDATLAVYPNPASVGTYVYVELADTEFTLTVTTITGQVILVQEGAESIASFSTDGFVAGTYTVSTTDSEGNVQEATIVVE